MLRNHFDTWYVQRTTPKEGYPYKVTLEVVLDPPTGSESEEPFTSVGFSDSGGYDMFFAEPPFPSRGDNSFNDAVTSSEPFLFDFDTNRRVDDD